MLIVPSTIGAPSTLTIVFQRGLITADLSQVTGVTFNVLRRDGTTTALTAAIVSAIPSELVAQYTFMGGEITTTGTYYIAPTLAVSGGTVPAETVTMLVTSPFAAQPQLETTAWLAATSAVLAGPATPLWFQASPAGSPYTLTRVTPYVALDLRTGAITANLWQANDGDEVTFGDPYAAVSSGHSLTLNGAASQNVPSGAGTYTASGSFTTTSAFPLRLKFSAALGAWLYR